MNVTVSFLRTHRDHIFVFGDNIERTGKGGAAELRDELNTYGFITKRAPNFKDEAYFTPKEYKKIYQQELMKLKAKIQENPSKTFLISKIGSGLANKHGIFEEVIEPGIKKALKNYKNVIFLW